MAFRDGRPGDACTRPGPSLAREPKGRAFLQRSGREEPRRGGEKSSTVGLRAAPATIGNPPCNRERGSSVDELVNRGLITGVGGQRTKTRERARGNRRHSRVGERLDRGLVQERSGARTRPPADRSRGSVSPWA